LERQVSEMKQREREVKKKTKRKDLYMKEFG